MNILPKTGGVCQAFDGLFMVFETQRKADGQVRFDCRENGYSNGLKVPVFIDFDDAK